MVVFIWRIAYNYIKADRRKVDPAIVNLKSNNLDTI